MLDSSLRVTWCFFSCHHSDSIHCSRMTARVNCVSKEFFTCCVKRKECKSQAVPGHGEGVSGADGRGKYEQKRKRVSYRAVLNICLSFLNEVKNLAEVARFKYSHLCTQARHYRLALFGTFSQRQSVSLCFRVAMLLKTQFACLRSRGQLTLRKKKIIVFII